MQYLRIYFNMGLREIIWYSLLKYAWRVSNPAWLLFRCLSRASNKVICDLFNIMGNFSLSGRAAFFSLPPTLRRPLSQIKGFSLVRADPFGRFLPCSRHSRSCLKAVFCCSLHICCIADAISSADSGPCFHSDLGNLHLFSTRYTYTKDLMA